jgi:hypothetical protein
VRPVRVPALHPGGAHRAAIRRSIGVTTAAVAASLALCATAAAAAPAPCGGIVQISDDDGDGHHTNTDVQSAWFSEAGGRLQVVVKVHLGDWAPAHDDSDAAGFAVLFEIGGQRRYVRLEAPQTGPLRFDYGTWTLAGGFASAGPTTGAVVTGFGGTVTIDVPAATGAASGAVLVRPFVMTYDGATSPSDIHWVDRGPGGVTPTEAAFGADYVVGSCAAGGPGPGGGAATKTTSLVITAPKHRRGTGSVRIKGRVVAARAGVAVKVTAKPRRSSKPARVRTVKTFTDGTFAVSIPLSETSTINAVADGINAQTHTVTMRSTVRLRVQRLRNGTTRISGRVNPRLLGRVLLLRQDAVSSSATTRARKGRFRFSARRLPRGRYQAVFIPSGKRAERATSRSGVVR